MASLNAFGNAFSAWVPLLAWKTVEAPKYFKGYLMILCILPVYVGATFVVLYLYKKETRQREKEEVETIAPIEA